MSTGLLERLATAGAGNGGVPARRAVIRWAWRMFRREWRQQLLVLALIVVAVAAIVVGSAVASDTPPPADAGFGTATDMATFQAPDPHLASQIAALQHRFGKVDVIENQTVAIPGSIDTYDLRAQNPHGPYGQPLLSLVSGHYPAGPGQVAVTSGVASALHLTIGSSLRSGSQSRRVVGIVQNPQSLLDEFALVVPGQVSAPTQVTVLFDAPGVRASSIGPNVQTPGSALAASSNPLNPTTIMLALATVGMLLIALVGVGGFTVLAQRRLRSLGMLGALGATDRNVRLVVRANGVLVGVSGALAGLVLGLAAWLAYRPVVESDAHHLIGTFQLPWIVIGSAMALAVLASYFAASRPARSITRIPIVTALSGRPAPPRQVRRSAVPGLVLLGTAVVLFVYTGKSNGNGGGMLELVAGFVVLIAAVILLAPFCLTVLARLGRRAPIAPRLALRDLARYRARSGSALAAISLGMLIAVLICVLSAQRFGNVLDYAGPNLASNQIIVYTPNGPGGAGIVPGGGSGQQAVKGTLRSWDRSARGIAAALGSHDVVQLEQSSGSLQHATPGRQWSGPVFVATPQLLRAFGIKASQVSPDSDILTMRPGLSGLSDMQLVYGNYFTSGVARPGGGPQGQPYFPCPASDCLASPVIQEVSTLPSGTSAPNTVITEHAIRALGLQRSVSTTGWLIQTPNPPTAGQVSNARLAASAAGMTIETRNSIPTSADIINWATVFGIVLALGILAMTVGLIRSETASDLRTLAATGASSWTRRNITAATAGALALAGAVLGTVAAYAAAIGYSADNSLDGLSELSSVPTTNLLLILVGMPLAAAAGGWLLAGRDPAAITRQPIE
ncbi:MAG TPA: FtsX-like permease family protein [Streptosporangiaceae bacterium]|nr:FtsX-like permease family protein [Streptosporangiaceae bacterium]